MVCFNKKLPASSPLGKKQVMTLKKQPLLTHLLELRRRLVYALISFLFFSFICYFYAQPIFSFLVQPLADVIHQAGQDRRLIYTGLTEAFVTYIKIAAFSGGVLSFPFMATQLWLFVAPGLYKHERGLFLPLLIATPFLFLAGALFAYYIVFPTAYSFFLSFETPGTPGGLPIQLEAKVNEYLSFVMRLIFAFGISFELPVLLTLLASTKRLTASYLVAKWRFAVVGIFTLAAFITPPDIFSMLALAFPLILLYGISILMVRVVERRLKRKEEKESCTTLN